MSDNEIYARKNTSKLIHHSFEYPWDLRARAMEALRALRPKRRRGKKESLKYNDLFYYNGFQLPNLELNDRLILIPEVVDFILKDKKSYDADWSGLLYTQSVLRNNRLRNACNPEQKLAIRLFISYLINWRLKMHGCEIFKYQFEAILKILYWLDNS